MFSCKDCLWFENDFGCVPCQDNFGYCFNFTREVCIENEEDCNSESKSDSLLDLSSMSSFCDLVSEQE